MAAWWIASYVALWVLVLIVCALLIGMLRQFGALQLQLGSTQVPTVLPVEQDGPTIGSLLPDLEATTANGVRLVALGGATSGKSTLITFLNTMCESCQKIVDPLNELARSETHSVHPIVIVQASKESCESFLSVFPLNMPVVCDGNRAVTNLLEVHRSPFGLLYDSEGHLLRKGAIVDETHLHALLGDVLAAQSVGDTIFPAPTASQVASGASV